MTKPPPPPAANRWQSAIDSPHIVVTFLLILWAVMTGLYISAESTRNRDFGFSLDDAWIHAVMARNIAQGNGYSFNPGEPISASSAPLYTVLLAGWNYANGDLIWGAKILGMFGILATALLLYLAGRQLGSAIAGAIAGVFSVVSASMLLSAVSGMELGIYFIVPAGALYCYSRQQYGWMIALLGLGVWLRPDALFMLGLGWLAVPRPIKLRTALIAAAIVVPYIVFNYAISGYPLPVTVRTKSALQTAHFSTTFLSHSKPPLFGQQHWTFWILYVLGVLTFWRKAWWAAIFPPLFYLLLWATNITTSNFGRYLYPLLPYAYLTAGFGANDLFSGSGWKRYAKWGVVIVLLLQIWTGVRYGGFHATAVENINNMQVAIGKVMGHATRPDEVIAVNDVGAIKYFSNRPLVDLVGLVTPMRPFEENITRYHPAVVAIFDKWFRDEIQQPMFRDNYELFGALVIKDNVVCADSAMSVYVRRDRFDDIQRAIDATAGK